MDKLIPVIETRARLNSQISSSKTTEMTDFAKRTYFYQTFANPSVINTVNSIENEERNLIEELLGSFAIPKRHAKTNRFERNQTFKDDRYGYIDLETSD